MVPPGFASNSLQESSGRGAAIRFTADLQRKAQGVRLPSPRRTPGPIRRGIIVAEDIQRRRSHR